jgi:hypothetical protein
MHSHHVPNGLPTCSASSQQVLQDVLNSTSFLSPTTFAQSCHLVSYIGGPKEQLLYLYLGSENFYFRESPKFHFFLGPGPIKEAHHQEKIWTWEAPTTKYSLSCVNGMSTHLLDKCLLKYQIAHICRVYQNCPFCGHNMGGYIYFFIKIKIYISDACMYTFSCGMFWIFFFMDIGLMILRDVQLGTKILICFITLRNVFLQLVCSTSTVIATYASHLKSSLVNFVHIWGLNFQAPSFLP